MEMKDRICLQLEKNNENQPLSYVVVMCKGQDTQGCNGNTVEGRGGDCTVYWRIQKPTSSSEKKENSKQGQQGTQRHGEEEDCGTSIDLTSTDDAVPRTRLYQTLITKQMTDGHCPQRAHSPMGLPRGTHCGDELHVESCGDTKETSDPVLEDRRRLPRKDDTGIPKAIRVKRRKT